jgi:hypothetical protein
MRIVASFEVSVCGGGIAGAGGLLRLRRLAGDRIRLTPLSPDEALVYRPLSVRDPFSGPGAREYPIERIAADRARSGSRIELLGSRRAP